MEFVGNIKIDYSSYIGKDLYSDGAIEDVLLDIVKSHDKEEYSRIIRDKQEWAILYHLSNNRGNIVEWMDDDKLEQVVEL